MPNKKLLLLSFLSLCVLSYNAAAQAQQVASVIHNLHKITSTNVNEERTILVHLPASYENSSQKYPVVYMLDGHYPQPGMMGGILSQQAWGRQIPEMILVSIQNTNRSRDLTPTDDGKGGTVGGGDKFLSFIEKEVIPLVEKNYRTENYRIFVGHSLGGLIVVHSMNTQPNLFNGYIAASPVLHYDDNFVIKETEKLFERTKEFDKTLFLGLGDEPEYKNGWNKYQRLLKDKSPKNFNYEFREFNDDNHASVVLPVYYAGLRKIFEGWVPKKTGTLSELNRHYENLSKRFGFTINIPEDTMNAVGYQFMQQGKINEAIDVFEKNAANYPDSANVYDSLGEALEKKGDRKRALENYQKAYNLAIKLGDERRVSIFKTNLDRVSSQ